jgi:integrase/recombinase XerD
MAGPRLSSRQPRPPGLLDAGPLSADIASFRLHLAAEGKSARTVQGYTSAVRWFAAGYLLGQAGKTSWDQVNANDIRQWMVQLLDRYSSAYASIQFRALRQFFKWRAAEDESPDPMTRLRAPKVTVTAVPVFTSAELSELQKACQGRPFAARRDAAIIAVLTATGIRLSELAGICCHPGDPARSDLDLQAREIRIRGKGRTARTVMIGHRAARSLDRYLRARARHPQAWRSQLWLGVNGRGPLAAGGIYQAVARRGRQAGVSVYPHRFRHHFSHTWLDRGGAERDLMELNGWTSPQMLTRYGASARGARARRSYDRIMDDTT